MILYTRYSLLILLILTNFTKSKAQEIGAIIDFFGYADNREYKAPHTIDKTFFGAILSPQLYLQLHQNHKLITGIHYNQDFGISSENKNRINPIGYYNYTNENIDFALGFIPRHSKLRNIPLVVFSDTLQYDRVNIEGIYLDYHTEKFTQSIYIDWLSKQGQGVKERFIAGISGFYKFGKGYFANDATLYHNALTNVGNPDDHIQDNAVAVVRLGIDLSNQTSLDSMTIDVGGVLGVDRLRTIYDRTSKAFISNIHLGYRQFFLHNTLYIGEAINVPNGDSYYHRDKYNRVDLGWYPFKNKNIDGKFTASFHLYKGGIDNQQAFTLRYRFDESLWKK